MTAIPLLEYAKGEDLITRGVVDVFVQTSDFLERLNVETVGQGSYKYNLEQSLGGMAFRGLNESYTPDYSVENPQVEQTYIIGGECDVDVVILDRYGRDRKTRDVNRKVKKFARVWTDKFINGDNSSDVREFDGLKRRITGTQLIANSTASGGAALSLAKLDELMDKVAGGETRAFIMAPQMRRRFWALIRNQSVSGYIMETRDSLGRPMISYAGIPILVGFSPDGPDTAPVAFDEVASGGGGAVTSSIYLVDFGPEGIMGIQDSPIRAKDLGELQDKPAERVRVEGTGGLVIPNGYHVGRLSSITDAAIVA